jgi:hypothetical protein
MRVSLHARFDARFNLDIQQLLHALPADKRTADGALFWSPPKVCCFPVVNSRDEPLFRTACQRDTCACAGIVAAASSLRHHTTATADTRGLQR